jgi:hypothetical protein
MHELIALTKLSLLQFRWVYFTFIAAIISSPLLALVYPTSSSTAYVDSLLAIWMSLAVAAGFAGVTLFDFTQRGDLISPQSGCNHWLLRMPVASWKIALTPVVLKTVWFAMMWGVIATIITINEIESVPIFGPALCFSGGAIGLMATSWMPFRRGWHRLILVPIILITAYFLLCLITVAPHTHPQWRTVINVSGPFLSTVFYASAVAAAFWVTQVARTSTLGLTSERQWSIKDATDSDLVQTYRDPGHAFAWHEFYRSRNWALRAIAIGVLPAILFFGVIFPINEATIVMAFIVFTYVAAFAVGGTGDMPAASTMTGFQTYLLISPLSTARLAWTRLAVRISIAVAVYSTIFVAFGCAMLWSTNRNVWSQWAADVAGRIGTDLTPFHVGIRVFAAIILVASLFLVGQIASHWWFGLSGNSRFSLAVIFTELAIIFIPLSIFLHWFLRQSDWGNVQTAFSSGLMSLPTLAARLLAIKLIAVIGAGIMLVHLQLCNLHAVLKIVAVWGLFVMLVGLAVSRLLPLPQATFMACASGIAIITPLARILIMPVTLAYGRHR